MAEPKLEVTPSMIEAAIDKVMNHQGLGEKHRVIDELFGEGWMETYLKHTKENGNE